jgi:uncharacterized membrane protein YphA (DoxX/SURF4 family)
MKIICLVARILLGLIFVIFGLNGFLNFIHGPMPGGMAGLFLNALIVTHYVYLVAGTQILSGILLLSNRFVPLALALFAPVLANILAYHLTMSPTGMALPTVVALLWIVLFLRHQAAFAPLFKAKD